jgi:hypothetical protein
MSFDSNQTNYLRRCVRAIMQVGVFAMTAAAAHAAPAISSISGSVSDGAAITIAGSSFGSGDSTPLVWENFDAGASGSGLTNPRVGSWQLDSRPQPIYSGTRAHSGSKSAYAAYNSSNQWSFFTVKLPDADKFYQTFWFWWSSQGTQGQLKLVQVHGDSNQGDYAPGIMTGSSTTDWWFSYISTESGANNTKTQVTYPKTPAAGSWHKFEMAMKRSSGGNVADGNVAVWIDGQQQYSRQNAVTRDNSAYNWAETAFFHGVTNMNASTDVYIDDAYLNNSWSRVVVGNAATYSAVTQTEIQPVSAWSSGSIQITLNRGSLANFDNAYLYVVDENGGVNSTGYKLCTGCTQPPPPPQAKTPSPPSGVAVN